MRKREKPKARSRLDSPRKAELGGFQIAKEYEHLAGAPVAEFETCITAPLVKVDLRASAKRVVVVPKSKR